MATVQPQSKFLAAESMDATFISDEIDLSKAGSCSLELYSASNTHAGAVTIEVSNSGDNWTAIGWTDPSSGAYATSDTVSAGSAYSAFVDLSHVGARYMRVVYTTSPTGTGTMDGWIFGKNWSRG